MKDLRQEADELGVEAAFFDHDGQEWKWRVRPVSAWSHPPKTTERAALEEGIRVAKSHRAMRQ